MKKDIRRQTALFLVIGLLALIPAYYLLPEGKRPEFWSTAVLTGAFVIIAVGILNVVWWLAGGEPISTTLDAFDSRLQRSSTMLEESRKIADNILNELRRSVSLLRDSRETGLQQILTTSSEFEKHGGDWMGRLRSTQNELGLMGFSLLAWTKSKGFKEEILRLVNNGVQVRIMIMDLVNPDFDSFVNKNIVALKSDQAIKGEVESMRGVFEDIDQAVKKFPQKPRGTFEFRTISKGLIVCQICRTDDELIAIPYLFSVVASASPLIMFQGEKSGLYQIYQNEFEHLWNDNHSKRSQ